MQMGKYLLNDLETNFAGVTHQNFSVVKNLLDLNGDYYFKQGMDDVGDALKTLYGENSVSLQQLSATFRRGDLIDTLNEMQLRERPPATATIAP
jgi:hypothetical protein